MRLCDSTHHESRNGGKPVTHNATQSQSKGTSTMTKLDANKYLSCIITTLDECDSDAAETTLQLGCGVTFCEWELL